MTNTAKLELETFLPYIMVRCADRLSTTLANLYRQDYGITTAEWRVMANLHQYGHLMSKEIASRTTMDKVKVSRAVQSLCDKGWIKKRENLSDSRAYLLSMTAKGKSVMNKIVPRVLGWQNELLSAVTQKEFAALLQTLKKLETRLDRFDSITD